MTAGLLETLVPDSASRSRLAEYADRLLRWNRRVNLVSRKDADHLLEHHLLHAVVIGKFVSFPEDTTVLDIGTGGGLPGIPLAILFPETRFVLVDSVAKKARAVSDMIDGMGLENCIVRRERVEELDTSFHYAVGRAVAPLAKLIPWVASLLLEGGPDGCPFGLIYLKGSHYLEECNALGITPYAVHQFHDVVPIPYYEEKYLLHFRTGDLRPSESVLRP